MLLFIAELNKTNREITDFNTSHVTVYRFRNVGGVYGRKFQYISCYCLSWKNAIVGNSKSISIHLMLLFITLIPLSNLVGYCISIHLMLLFIYTTELFYVIVRNFNTSHVTVYHRYYHLPLLHNGISIHLMLLFILIPLSNLVGYCISIHLMLLFIMQDNSLHHTVYDFNTSHVTVYHIIGRLLLCCSIISIHLMLLFIRTLYFPLTVQLCISIHLMLLFIVCGKFMGSGKAKFQYISCYCLSRSFTKTCRFATKFQYISCYCLSCIELQGT